MTGNEYANLIAEYVLKVFGDRGIEVYREVNVGKSIIGKNRRVDLLVICQEQNEAFAIECKFQDVQGTVDEKIPYALQDMESFNMGGCICYAGRGFSQGVLHMLQASETACYCLPDAENIRTTADTRELDHQIALHFKWWDVFVRDKKAFTKE